MSSIDRRAVDMKFDYKEFAAGITGSLSLLDRLKKGLKLDGASKGLSDISKQAKNVNLGTISSQLDGISGKFRAMSVVGIAALGTIASKATMVGLDMAKSLTIAPVTGGLSEYEKKLGSIQTILANTSAAGTKLEDVNKTLNELNEYSDKTIYNFGEMAKNIGTFTAAGVDLETATGSIKGIANLAALSGSSSEQASTAMYQLSQAISAGKVSLTDWNSVVNAGMGGSVFQRSLAETAVAMGKLPESAVKLEGAMKNVKINGQAFRESISAEGGGPSWLTSDVLTTALKNFTGDMKEADLVAQGFSASQAKAIMAQAKLASDAATVVKTGSQLMGTLKESAESGWATTWELIIGDFEEAKTLWTGVNNVFGGLIQQSSDARNNLLKDWKKLGGRTALIEGIKNAWAALSQIVKAVKDAFKEVFPPATGKKLYELTVAFRDFAKSLTVSGDNFQRIKSIFEGVFSVFRILQIVVTQVVKALFNVFGTMGAGSGAVLQAGASLGEFLRTVADLLQKTGGIEKFFTALLSPLAIIKPLIKLLSDLATAIFSLFSGDTAAFQAKFIGAFDTLRGSLGGVASLVQSTLAPVISTLERFANTTSGAFGSAAKAVSDLLGGLSGSFGEFNPKLVGFSTNMDVASGGASKFAAVGEFLRNIWEGVAGAFSGVGEGLGPIVASIGNFFKVLTDKLSEFIKGLDFQEAVALLNAGFFILLYKALKNFMNNINDLIGNVSKIVEGVRETFGALTDTLKSMQNSIRAGMILKIAIAVGILAASVIALSKVNGEDLKKAMLALSGLFVQVGIVFALLTKYNPASFTSAATGLVLMAFAIKLLAGSVQMLGEMDPKVLVQGGVALGTMIAALSAFLTVADKIKGSIPSVAAGLLILSFALITLAGAIKIYAAMDISTIAKGLGAVAAILVVVGTAMRAMPKGKGMVGAAVAFGLMAGAILVLTSAVAILGNLDITTLLKGVIAMDVALTSVVVAANGMVGALPGAAAMIIMAGAIAILAATIAFLGQLEIKTILIGLGALVGIFLAIGLAAVVLTPVIPIIALLGLAMLSMGKGLFLVGAGMLLFASGLALLAVSGAAGFAVLVVGITSFLNLIPLFVQQLGLGLLAAVVVIREVGPKLVESIAAIIGSFIVEVTKLVPKFGNLIYTVIKTGIDILVKLATPFATAGLKILLKLLEFLGKNIGKIVDVVAKLAKKFIESLGKQQKPMVDSGIKFIIKFINELATAIDRNSEQLGRAGGRLGVAIVKGMVKAIFGGISEVVNAAKEMAGAAFNAAKKKLGINSPSKVFQGVGSSLPEGFAKGVNDNTGMVVKSTQAMGQEAINAMKGTLQSLSGLVSDNLDATPVIRPLLDLSAVQGGMSGMASMFGGQSVSVDSNYSQASSASAEYASNKEAVIAQNGSDFASSMGGGMTFNQYNSSPKALTTAEIYRQTKNQLSVAKKGALTVTT